MDAKSPGHRLRSKRAWFFLGALYLLGVAHWIFFFYFVYPEGGDRTLFHMVSSPAALFESHIFTAHDWYREIKYQTVIHEAVRTGTLPFHMPEFSKLVFSARDRFLATPIWPMSPQILLHYLLDPYPFSVVNLLLLYSVGFYGCLLLRNGYNLSFSSFVFLFLLFNFNGHFVEKIAVQGSTQTGYFFMPYLLYAIFRASEVESGCHRDRLRWGIILGLVLAAILYQGSLHLFVECVTLVLIWGVVNPQLWAASLGSLLTAFLAGAVRLLPAAVSYGVQANPHAANIVGYGQPDMLIEALVMIRTHLSPPAFAWWEFSLYVSLVGLVMMLYFGLWGPFMSFPWVRFRGWRVMAVPCAVIALLSVRDWKAYIIPNWIPLLNAESVTARYMIIPLLVVVVIAAINFQGFVDKYWGLRKVRYALLASLAVIAGFLFNHSRMWRMHKVQFEFDRVMALGLFGEKPDPTWLIVPRIVNDYTDSWYITSFWVGLVISCVAFVVVIGLLLRERWLHHRFIGTAVH